MENEEGKRTQLIFLSPFPIMPTTKSKGEKGKKEGEKGVSFPSFHP